MDADAIKEKRRRILEEPRIARLIIELSLPLFVSGSLQSLYGIIDTFWLSRLGTAELGTPTVSWPFRGVLMSIGFGLATAISALVGQYIGKGDYKRASKSLGGVLGLLLAIGVPGSILFYVYRWVYLDVTNVTPEIRPLADAYIAVTLAGIPFTYLFLAFNFGLGAAGDTVTPMKVSVATTLLNFALDPVLIFYAGWGVVGAAAATLVANAIAGLYAAYNLFTGRHGVRVEPGHLVPTRELLRKVAGISTPMMLQRLMTTFGFIAMMRIVNGLGTAIVAAYSIGQVFLSLDHVIVFPLIRGTGIVVAQSLGARLIDRAKQAARTGLVIMTGLVGVYIIGLVVFRGYFVALFTEDPAVYEAADRMLLIFGPSVLGFDLFMLANSIARASGHTVFMGVLGIARLWAMRVPLSYYLAYPAGMGDTGLWAGMAASNWVTGAVATIWLLSGRWAKPVID